MKPRMSHAIFLALVGSAGLFALKFAVEQKEIELTEMKDQYLADQKAIRVLHAEWAYLNSPDYLQEMAEKYLMLKPVASKQVVAWFDHVPERNIGLRKASLKVPAKSANQKSESLSGLSPGGGDEP